jgi:thiol-disulfide isomerase/thioredoxin
MTAAARRTGMRPSLAKLLVVGVLGLVVAGAARPAAAEVKEGDRFIELDVAKTAAGKKFRLKDLSGSWVLFTFGAKWCKPCAKELPAWDKLAPKYAGKVVFVSININNKVDEGKAFMKSLGIKNLQMVFLPDDQSAAMKSYDPDHMPSTFVIDPRGIVRLVQYGYDKGDEHKLAASLDKLIQ